MVCIHLRWIGGVRRRDWKLTRSKQVLFKRKPVQYLPRPVIEDDSSEVRITRVEFALALKSRTLDVG